MSPQKYTSASHLSGKVTASREKSPSSQPRWSSVKLAEAMGQGEMPQYHPGMAKPEARETAKSRDKHGPSHVYPLTLLLKAWVGTTTLENQ